MLVIMRREKQTIAIGDDIVIHVGKIIGDKVKLAIDAPRDVIINRGELILAGKMYGSESGGVETVTEDVEHGRGRDA